MCKARCRAAADRRRALPLRSCRCAVWGSYRPMCAAFLAKSGKAWQNLASSSKSSIRIRLRLRIRPEIRLREITLLRKGRCCAARDRRRALPSRSCRCACARAPALTKNAHAGEGFSPLLQKSAICRRGEIALFGIYFAFKARKTFFGYLRSSRTRSCA